jgi:hypothetical protein
MIRLKSHRWKTWKSARNPEPTNRGRFARDAKNSCHNSQEEKDGQCARRCYRDYEGLEPAPKKIAKATKVQDVAKAGPSAPIETKAIAPEDKAYP